MAKKDDKNTPAEMVAEPAATPAVMPEPTGGWPADEFTGKGGSYIRDPLTGKRSAAPAVTESAE